VALGFEFVNGFHDTANAVATVIYTTPSSRTSLWSGRGCGIFLAS
jgi:phosphate/sulfate permease